MNKKLVAILFSLILSQISYSQQFPSDLWHQGKLVLANDEILEGVIKYDMTRGVVQIEINDKLYTHGAKSIFYFKIFDATIEGHREFYVLPYGLVTSYKAPVIFEVLVEGNLSLLSREYITSKNVQSSSPYYYGSQSYQKDVLMYDYYFLDRKGEITPYNLKKKELMQAVSLRQSKVAEYMKSNRLKFDRRNDLIRIIAFYNALL